MNLRTLISAFVLASAATGCTAQTQPTESTGAQSSADTYYYSSYYWSPSYYTIYSWDLYGRDLNGRSLNGNDLTGHGVLGVSFASARLRGRALSGVTLSGTTFSALGAGGRDFVGATFDATLDDGSTLPMRIDGIDLASPVLDVIKYTVSYQTDSEWKPFCGTDAQGNPVKAIPLAGRWDYRQGVTGGGSHIADPQAFTFACEGYALAKCVDLGYRPWVTLRSCLKGTCAEISLADVHQACTRAIRADYCGDGTSYTNDGQLIDVADKYGIRIASPGWPFEAEWDAHGARCAARERVPSRGTPTCWASLQSATCGSPLDFFGGALVMTQDAP